MRTVLYAKNIDMYVSVTPRVEQYVRIVTRRIRLITRSVAGVEGLSLWPNVVQTVKRFAKLVIERIQLTMRTVLNVEGEDMWQNVVQMVNLTVFPVISLCKGVFRHSFFFCILTWQPQTDSPVLDIDRILLYAGIL